MKVGTEQDWEAARKELLTLEGELQEHAERVAQERRELPWVPVEKEYGFATAPPGHGGAHGFGVRGHGQQAGRDVRDRDAVPGLPFAGRSDLTGARTGVRVRGVR